MAERSFTSEVQDLRLGAGPTITGEGILAITKALLENGVGHVGGYQGAPISHLMDVLADAGGLLAEWGMQFEASANEAAAAAMLAASVHHSIRGAVTFKGPVGVNVATDARANLASSGVPIAVLNVTDPPVPSEVPAFCDGKPSVLAVEEGQPEFIEQARGSMLYRAGSQVRLYGQGVLPMAGEYTGAVLLDGVSGFLKPAAPKMLAAEVRSPNADAPAIPDLRRTVPICPPGFCTGCPDRPILAAMKLVEQELGKQRIAADIGCRLFASLPPFEIGGATMGYGLGPAANGAFDGDAERRPLAIIGDGGFWHNGRSSSFTYMVVNTSDGVGLVVDNSYSAATGGQDVMSSRSPDASKATRNPIARALRGIGIGWVRQVNHTYDVGHMRNVLREALTTNAPGPKVIVASSECMLNKQRRQKPLRARAMAEGRRGDVPRFGVDEAICTGDHACIRLSGCPSLSLKKLDDPLRGRSGGVDRPVLRRLRQLQRGGGCPGCCSHWRASAAGGPAACATARRLHTATAGWQGRRGICRMTIWRPKPSAPAA